VGIFKNFPTLNSLNFGLDKGSILGASAYHNKSQGVDMLVAKIKEVIDGADAHKDSHSLR